MGPLIEDIRPGVHDSLSEAVESTEQDGVIEFALPPHTSVILGFSHGGHDLFTALEVNSENRQVSMTDQDYRDYFEVFDRLVGAVVHVYNFR